MTTTNSTKSGQAALNVCKISNDECFDVVGEGEGFVRIYQLDSDFEKSMERIENDGNDQIVVRGDDKNIYVVEAKDLKAQRRWFSIAEINERFSINGIEGKVIKVDDEWHLPRFWENDGMAMAGGVVATGGLFFLSPLIMGVGGIMVLIWLTTNLVKELKKDPKERDGNLEEQRQAIEKRHWRDANPYLVQNAKAMLQAPNADLKNTSFKPNIR